MTYLSAALLHASSELVVVLAVSARTDLDDAGIAPGHLDPPLNPAGVTEARLLGRTVRAVLSPIRPLRIVHSPLLRAAQTTQAIVNAMAIPPQVTSHHGLIDRDYGAWAGRSLVEIAGPYGALDDAPGVETSDQVLRRTYEVLGTLRAGPVVVVTHDANVDVLLAALGCLPSTGNDITATSAGCHLLVRGGDGWELHAPARGHDDRLPDHTTTTAASS